jgi:hypothetical protein
MKEVELLKYVIARYLLDKEAIFIIVKFLRRINICSFSYSAFIFLFSSHQLTKISHKRMIFQVYKFFHL